MTGAAPTARELLEEVDALMRRNRAARDAFPTTLQLPGPGEGELISLGDAGMPPVDAGVLPEINPQASELRQAPPQQQGTSESIVAPPLIARAPPVVAPDAGALPAGHPEADAHGAEAHHGLGTANDEIPLLTEVAELDRALMREQSTQEPELTPLALHVDASPHGPLHDTASSADASGSDDLPLLTEVVDDLDVARDSAPGGLPSSSTPDDDEEALIGGLPADAFGAVTGLVRPHTAVIPDRAPLDPGDPRWSVLAEDIRMQVLQRLDLFTERGLQAHLDQYLQPIVARASAELLEAINTQLGQVLRVYVAEAIEREIEKWRHDAH
ncbi:MAG: hypothetical protein M3Z31_18495 [Pseudomonadota bacterium]|nr:hypothetical protein [Pseudomonadota bacterium]